mmetsp:Transcript_24254/g.61711  ORF Transcript_24254/g.61711 Transcript_24254/m.61711 type:complete len:350 (-) Transcript_24254:176-1225(-)
MPLRAWKTPDDKPLPPQIDDLHNSIEIQEKIDVLGVTEVTTKDWEKLEKTKYEDKDMAFYDNHPLNDFRSSVRILITVVAHLLMLMSVIGTVAAVVLVFQVEEIDGETLKTVKDTGCTAQLLVIFGCQLAAAWTPMIFFRSEGAPALMEIVGFCLFLYYLLIPVAFLYSVFAVAFGGQACSNCSCPPDWDSAVSGWTFLGFITSLMWMILMGATGILHSYTLNEYPFPLGFVITMARVAKGRKEAAAKLPVLGCLLSCGVDLVLGLLCRRRGKGGGVRETSETSSHPMAVGADPPAGNGESTPEEPDEETPQPLPAANPGSPLAIGDGPAAQPQIPAHQVVVHQGEGEL